MLVANASNLTSTPLSSSFKSEIQNELDSARVDRKVAGLLELNLLVSRCFQAFINRNDRFAIRDSERHSIEAMGIDEKERVSHLPPLPEELLRAKRPVGRHLH